MKTAPHKILILVLLLAQWLVAAPMGNAVDPIKEKDSTKTKSHVDKSMQLRMQQLALRSNATLGLENYSPSVPKTFKSFPELDAQLAVNKEFHVNYDQSFEPEFNEKYLEENFTQSGRVDELIGQAEQLIDKLKELNNFVDVLTGNDLLSLPVGLRKTDPTSGNEIIIAVSSVRFHSEYAELKLWAKMDIPQSNKSLIFGAEGVKFSRQGALVGEAKLVLLGDFPIAFNGDNWLLTLKGDQDLKTGNFDSKSYISIDCEGLKEVSLDGNLKVSRNVLLPLKDDGSYMCGDSKENFPEDENGKKQAREGMCYVETSFSVVSSGWNDVLIDVTLPDFEMVGLKSWAFNIENAVLDLSDTRNSDNVQFPEVYNQLLPSGNRNLWRGLYAQEVRILLPQAFEKITGNEKRVDFKANNLIIDSFGLSGEFTATNLLDKGAAGKWGITIDSLGLNLAVNTVVGGKLTGDLKVPILEQPLGYRGWIAENEYGLSVSLLDHSKDEEEATTYDVPMFLGEMQLLPNSSVALKVKDDKIYPSANLTGSLTVAGKVGQDATDVAKDDNGNPLPVRADGFNFRGISFQELELQTEPDKPYIQAKHFGFDGEFQLLFFPVTISKMELVTPSNTTAGLKFDMVLHLDDSGKGASTSLNILGKIEDEGKLHSWEFEKVTIGKIGVDFERSGIHLKGELEFLNNDAEFGDGFQGNLTATIEKLDLEVGGKARFGSKPITENSEETFRYWFFDAWQKETKGGDGKFLIDAFMGGISNHMRRTDGNSIWSPTQSTYTPDYELGLGLRAGVSIGVAKKTTFRGRAVLEMVFNRVGGLNRLGFAGEGAFMTAQSEENLDEDLKLVQELVNDWAEANPELYQQYNSNGSYLDAAREAIPIREVASSGKIGVYVGIERDFTSDTFHGTFELYLSTSGLRGAGPNNKAGFATLHTSPDEWYLHIGSPTDRLGLVFSVGDVELEVGGYFMTGNMLPTQLAPHPRVIQILGDDILDTNRRPNELSRGSGFAFGLNFSVRKSFQYYIFYATLEAGVGFDVMHRHYPDAKCRGRSGPIGNDGWYSMGNVYSWLYGEFGVGVKLLFIKKRVKIAEAGIAALLQGQFPNPTYFKGYVGMHFSVLGGLVKGRLRLKIAIGDECELEGVNSVTEVPIISDLTPLSGSDDVDVFTAPQAVFNYAVGKPFSIETDEGLQTYKIELKDFVLKSEGKVIPGKVEWNREGDAVTFLPDEVLPSKKEVHAEVSVMFQEKIGGSFRVVTASGGQPATEKRETKFITDIAPDHIPLENIAYMYPVIDQKNLYPKEYDKGYVKLKRGQTYLFDGGYTIKAQTTENGSAIRTDLGYNSAEKMLSYDLTDMGNSSSYTMDIMAFPPGENVQSEVVIEETSTTFDEEPGDTSWYDPSSDSQSTENSGASVTVANRKAANVTIANAEPKSLLSFNFETSVHNTFKSKMRSLSVVDNVTDIIIADVHSIHLILQEYENFDIPEVLGTKYTGGQSMVYGEAILKDSYYKNKIYPLNYQNYPLDGDIRVNREEEILGVPPVRGLDVPSWYEYHLRNQPTSHYVTERYPVMYNLPYYYKNDFVHLQYNIVQRYINNNPSESMYAKFKYLIDGTFPAMPQDSYKTYLIYRTPGNVHSSKHEMKFVNDN